MPVIECNDDAVEPGLTLTLAWTLTLLDPRLTLLDPA